MVSSAPITFGVGLWRDLAEAARSHAWASETIRSSEATAHLKRGPKVNPTWIWDYDVGPSAVMSVAEVAIQTKDGRRHRQDRAPEIPDVAVALVTSRRFARPWSVLKETESFIVQDASGFPDRVPLFLLRGAAAGFNRTSDAGRGAQDRDGDGAVAGPAGGGKGEARRIVMPRSAAS